MTWRRGRRRGKHSALGLKTGFSGAKFPVDLPVFVCKKALHTPKVFSTRKICITVFQPPGAELPLRENVSRSWGGIVQNSLCSSCAEVRIAWRLSAVLNGEREGVGRSLLQALEPSCPHDITCGHSCFATWVPNEPYSTNRGILPRY